MASCATRTATQRSTTSAALAPQHLMMMTRADRRFLGLWDGDLVLGADGIKRAEPIDGGGIRMVETSRAARVISVDGECITLKKRMTLAEGQDYNW